MTYRVFIIVILMLFASLCRAGEERYRVEILVLIHIQNEAVPSEAASLRDFSAALDLAKLEDDGATKAEGTTSLEDIGADPLASSEPVPHQAGAVAAGEAGGAPGPETGGELRPDEEQPEAPWADVVAVEDMSDVMSEAWRRLRLSAPFRPEQYLSWEQSANEPFPALRIRDQEVVLTDDPYADLRATGVIGGEPEKTRKEDRPVVFSDRDNLLPEGSPEEVELPDPTLFYRLDGTVMLRRSRFLHLDIDLELRTAVFDENLQAQRPVLSDENESDEPEPPVPTSFLIHTLKQSRQVKSQRMEYFDSPVLGVLAWITPFELEDETESDRTE